MQIKTSDIDIRDTFFDELYTIAQKDSNVIFLTADLGAFSLNKFKKDLPNQYINVGVAEQNLVSVAAGLALGGKKVYIYSIASFVTERCYEQIKIDIISMRLPITIIGSGGGISYNSDGITHHAIGDIAIMRAFPNITIINPCDSVSAKSAAEISYKSKCPVYIRIDKGKYPILYDEKKDFLDGMSLLKEGNDILIITTGIMVHQAFEIADTLAQYSINTGILDVYRLKPINESLFIDIIKKTKGIIVLEEHTNIGGLGSIVSEILVSNTINLPVKHFAIQDKYCDRYGDRNWMKSFYNLDTNTIVKEIVKWRKSTIPKII